jgi:hypothetical protein
LEIADPEWPRVLIARLDGSRTTDPLGTAGKGCLRDRGCLDVGEELEHVGQDLRVIVRDLRRDDPLPEDPSHQFRSLLVAAQLPGVSGLVPRAQAAQLEESVAKRLARVRVQPQMRHLVENRVMSHVIHCRGAEVDTPAPGVAKMTIAVTEIGMELHLHRGAR